MLGFIITGIIGLIFVIIGIVMLNGRGASLIAGYNTMSKAKKEKYDEAALCKFVGKIMIALGLLTFLLGIEPLATSPVFFVAWMIVFLAITVFAIVYANTKNRFKK